MVSDSLTDGRIESRSSSRWKRAMLIVCPNCATSYKVKEASLGSEGRTVRCARCKVSWFAAATSSTHALALHAPAMMADAGASSGMAADDRADAMAATDIMSPSLVERSTPGTGASDDAFPDVHSVEADSPPLVPIAGETLEGTDSDPSEDVETVAAKRQAQLVTLPPPKPARRPRLAFYIPLLLAVIVAAMAARTHIVRQFPQTASLFAAIGLPVNLRGLEFNDVVISNETENDVPVMIVQGNIRNITAQKAHVPRIRFGVRNNANVEVYAWTALPEKTTLGAGESLAFRSQLASPPGEANTVAVRFAGPHDREASR